MKAGIALAVIGFTCLAACSSKSSDNSSAGNSGSPETSAADAPSGGKDKLANVKPCDLLTDEEIGTANDNRLSPGQREGLHQTGAKYEVSKEEDRSGISPVCHVSWRAVAPGNDERQKGTFDIVAMTASQLKALEGMSRPKTGKRADAIAGVGDEAFYIEYAPAARVGDLGVSINEFTSADGGIELLKKAASRLH